MLVQVYIYSGKCSREHWRLVQRGLLQEKWRGESEGGGGGYIVEEGPLPFGPLFCRCFPLLRSSSHFCVSSGLHFEICLRFYMSILVFKALFCFWMPKGPKVDILGGLGVLKPQIPLQTGIKIVKLTFSRIQNSFGLEGRLLDDFWGTLGSLWAPV